MLKIKIHDLKKFENFLTIAGKFVQQGQLIVSKEKTCFFAKNQQEFSNSRLLLYTNVLTTNETDEVVKICLKDLSAFRSSISIVQTVENINELILDVEQTINTDNTYFAKKIIYTGKTKFKLVCVDAQIIEQYISKDLEVKLNKTWEFNIDPLKLDIIQNRTGSIVNVKDDVSIYIGQNTDTHEVFVNLAAKTSSFVNSFSLPISDNYNGSLTTETNDVAITESSFRLMNILRVTDKNNINCFFDEEYNVFCITSRLGPTKDDKYFIISKVLMNIVKGK